MDPSAGQHASFAYHPAHYHQHRPPPLEEPSYPYYNQPPAQEPPRNRSPSVSSVDSQSSYATTSSLNYLAADLSLGSQTSSCSSSNLPPLPPPPPVGEYIPPPQAGIHGPPKKKSHSKPKPEGHVPRPRNAFILFRTDVHTRNLIKNENKHGKISQIVADMWKNCTPEEKAPYQRAFEREKAEHKRLYPNYDYQPKNKKGADGKPAVAAKPPKRQAGSKAALKAQAVQAAREKKEAEKLEKERKLQAGDWDSDEEDEKRGSGSDEDDYISSSSASHKRSRNPSNRKRSPPNKKSSQDSRSSANNSSNEYDGPQDWESSENRYPHQPYPYQHHPHNPYPYPPSHQHPYYYQPPVPQRNSSRGVLGPIENGHDGWHAQQQQPPHHLVQHHYQQPPPHHRYPSEQEIASMRAEQGFHVGMPGSPEDRSPHEQHPAPHHHPQQPFYHQPTPQNGEYATYPDYRMPSQLLPSSSSSHDTSPTESQASSRPGTSQPHQMLPPSYAPPHNHSLPTAGSSPLTPGFPHAQTQYRRGSSISSLRKDATSLESLSELPPFTPGFQSFLDSYTNNTAVAPPLAPEHSGVALERSNTASPSSSAASSSSSNNKKKEKELTSLFVRAPLHAKSNSSSPESIESSHSSTTATSASTTRARTAGHPPVRPPRPAHADWNLAGQPIFVPPPPSNQPYPSQHGEQQPYYPPPPSEEPHQYQHQQPPYHDHQQPPQKQAQPSSQLPLPAPSSLSSRRRGKPPQPLFFPSSSSTASTAASSSAIPAPRAISFGQTATTAHLRAGATSYHLSSERTPTQASFDHQHQDGQQQQQQPQPLQRYEGQATEQEMSMGEGVESFIPSDWIPLYEGPEHWGQ